ncbi:MAG: biotin-dependent carboxyltransferase family protein [Flavobacteriaceae bacterium]|nr:biotin-dependent carboxyltransferase family protein [Flavobacteriaceae bacterium]
MIKVLQAGLYTSVQDMGRFGYRNIGVPVSGIMDSISAGFANALLNNDKNDAVLEITMHGPSLEFTLSTTIIITGAEMNPALNNIPVLNYKLYHINKGDLLTFGRLTKGLRCYLGVVGGFKTVNVLNSRSFYAGITLKGFLQKNDTIGYNKEIAHKNVTNPVISNKIQFFETAVIEVFKGPEFELFTSQEQKKLLSNMHTVSNQINRMGYRLEEVNVPHTKSIITSPVLPGTVQLTPSGQLIILMKDAQTTGGYPRVFQLTEKSIDIMAQKKTADTFNFKLL